MQDYLYKTQPYKHQEECFLRSRDEKSFAFLMEQGTGKTKVAIDTMAYLYQKGEIECAIIIAPKGVHTNWGKREIPTHMPLHVKCDVATWGGKSTKKEKASIDFLKEKSFSLKVFCINIDAVNFTRGYNCIKDFLAIYNTLLIIDESSRIKNHKSKRTKAVLELGKAAVYKRILTGTPVTQGPMDVYSQYNFLNPKILNFSSYFAFKAHYGDWEKVEMTSGPVRQVFERLIRYKNIDELVKSIGDHSYRVLKKDCLDLPPKVYKRLTVELSPDQGKYYKQLKEELLITLQDVDVSAIHKLTLLTKLHQILGGTIKTEEGEIIRFPSAKLNMLSEIIEDYPGKMIIWAKYHGEIDMIAEMIEKNYGAETLVQYHGRISNDDRDKAIDSFQDKRGARFFLANARSGGIGLTLTAAETVVYFTNSFDYEERAQSEDRAHRSGLKHTVTYLDIEAENTIDGKIIRALKKKKSYSNMVTGDDPMDWI